MNEENMSDSDVIAIKIKEAIKNMILFKKYDLGIHGKPITVDTVNKCFNLIKTKCIFCNNIHNIKNVSSKTYERLEEGRDIEIFNSYTEQKNVVYGIITLEYCDETNVYLFYKLNYKDHKNIFQIIGVSDPKVFTQNINKNDYVEKYYKKLCLASRSFSANDLYACCSHLRNLLENVTNSNEKNIANKLDYIETKNKLFEDLCNKIYVGDANIVLIHYINTICKTNFTIHTLYSNLCEVVHSKIDEEIEIETVKKYLSFIIELLKFIKN